MKGYHKDQVQHNITHRRGNEKVQRRPGIPQSGKDSGTYIIEKQKDKAAYIYVKV